MGNCFESRAGDVTVSDVGRKYLGSNPSVDHTLPMMFTLSKLTHLQDWVYKNPLQIFNKKKNTLSFI